MKINKTGKYLLLFVAAVVGSRALQDVFNTSTIVVLGLAVGILVGAVLSRK